MKKIDFIIEGMHCDGCSKRLERVLNNLENVKATVDFESKKASITYDSEVIGVDEIKQAIEDAGFTAK